MPGQPFVPYTYVLCTVFAALFAFVLLWQYNTQESPAAPTVKEKVQGLHKIETELSPYSCPDRQQSAVKKQVQEGKQSSFPLSLRV